MLQESGRRAWCSCRCVLGFQGVRGLRASAQVFVAGATGRLGARVVRELLEASPQLRVRVGVRNPERAARDLQAAAAYGLVPADAPRRVQLVPADVTRPETLPDAIGNASKACPRPGSVLPVVLQPCVA